MKLVVMACSSVVRRMMKTCISSRVAVAVEKEYGERGGGESKSGRLLCIYGVGFSRTFGHLLACRLGGQN